MLKDKIPHLFMHHIAVETEYFRKSYCLSFAENAHEELCYILILNFIHDKYTMYNIYIYVAQFRHT